MRAVVIRSFGDPSVIEIATVPTPEPGPGQVLIRVAAAAVNPVDLATRAGLLVDAGLMVPQPVIGLGWDVAGEVAAPAPGFAVGDQVIGLSDRLDVPLGTHADYVTLDTTAVAHAPKGIAPEAAATLPLNGLTAMQALDLLDLEPGATLLITGAAGAVGGYALELAVHRGIHVAAVANPQDFDWLRSRGAKWLISRSEPLAAQVRAQIPGGADAALDAAVTGIPALNAVRNRGAFIAVVAGATPTPLRGITVNNVWISANNTQLATLAALAESGHITPRVAETLPLEEAAQAHERLAKGALRGRIVLKPVGVEALP